MDITYQSKVTYRIYLVLSGIKLDIFNMVAKNTSTLLSRLRALMKNTNVVGETLHAYIVPHKDAHQVSFLLQDHIFY